MDPDAGIMPLRIGLSPFLDCSVLAHFRSTSLLKVTNKASA